MVKHPAGILPATSFSEVLIHSPVLQGHGFREWVFYPGMLFGSRDGWWGSGGSRDCPHEGVDLCLYRDNRGTIRHLPHAALAIPVLYDGTVVNVVEDYIGTSLFVLHDTHDAEGNQLCTIYGHTDPVADMECGVLLREGSIIATIADAGKKKVKMSSHLHLSIAWIAPPYPHGRLDWKYLAQGESALLVNPLPVISSPYSVVDYE